MLSVLVLDLLHQSIDLSSHTSAPYSSNHCSFVIVLFACYHFACHYKQCLSSLLFSNWLFVYMKASNILVLFSIYLFSIILYFVTVLTWFTWLFQVLNSWNLITLPSFPQHLNHLFLSLIELHEWKPPVMNILILFFNMNVVQCYTLCIILAWG